MKKRNMKIVMVAFIGILLLLGGCSSKNDEIYQNSIQKGLDAVAEDNFSKAEGLFEAAVEIKKGDVRAKAYLTQVQLILKADDLVKQSKIEDAILSLEQSMKVKEGSKVISSKSKDKKEKLIAIQDKKKNYNTMLTNAQKLSQSSDYQKSNEILDALSKEDLTDFASIKDEATKLKDSNDEAIRKAAADATAAAQAKAKDLANKVQTYRQQEWYGQDEDPNFTWDDAYNIIVKVLGQEDGTFIYNGRREVFMDDRGRRYYNIWTEDPNAANTAEGTMKTYLVYDDGSVEPNK